MQKVIYLILLYMSIYTCLKIVCAVYVMYYYVYVTRHFYFVEEDMLAVCMMAENIIFRFDYIYKHIFEGEME